MRLARAPRTPATLAAQSRRLAFWARIVLIPVALIGAVLSFRSLYEAANPTFGPYLAGGFPALVDLLILGASLQYVAGAKIGRPLPGWKLTAYAGVGATLALNALAAHQVGQVPWHIAAPAVWAVLVELTAAQVLGEYEAVHHGRAGRISLPLWVTAPIESARTRLLMARTGIRDAPTALTTVGVHAAAREALRLALPDRHGRRVRRIINRQLRAGSLPPAAILAPLGWAGDTATLRDRRPETILQAVLHVALDPATQNALTSAQTTPAPEPPAKEADLQTVHPAETPPETHLPEALSPQQQDSAPEDPPSRQSAVPAAGQEPSGASGGSPGGSEDDTRPAQTLEPLRQPGQKVTRTSAGAAREAAHQRLTDAVEILRDHPGLTAPDLRAALARKEWDLSDRTAHRVLQEATRALSEEHQERTLTIVGT